MMQNLMSQVEKLKFEKQDLEDRYKDLEERSKSQENTISYLQTENERLRRSTSPATSLHRPQHYGGHIQRSTSEPGHYGSRHHTEIRKFFSQDGKSVSNIA